MNTQIEFMPSLECHPSLAVAQPAPAAPEAMPPLGNLRMVRHIGLAGAPALMNVKGLAVAFGPPCEFAVPLAQARTRK